MELNQGFSLLAVDWNSSGHRSNRLSFVAHKYARSWGLNTTNIYEYVLPPPNFHLKTSSGTCWLLEMSDPSLAKGGSELQPKQWAIDSNSQRMLAADIPHVCRWFVILEVPTQTTGSRMPMDQWSMPPLIECSSLVGWIPYTLLFLRSLDPRL